MMDRRAFGLSLAALGISAMGASAETARYALISDLHISSQVDAEVRGFRPYEALKKILSQVSAQDWDGLILTGDMARLQGLPEDYQVLKTLLDPLRAKFPMHVSLGNHDDRTHFLNAFGPQKGEQPVKGKLVSIVENRWARLIMLDTQMSVNQTAGLFGKVQRTWLAEYLKTSSDLPTLLFFHHTPDDNDGAVLDYPRLWEIVRKEKKVKALVFGHSHRWEIGREERVFLVNVPSTAYTFAAGQPVGWTELTISRKGAEFRLHAVGADTSLDGKTVFVPFR